MVAGPPHSQRISCRMSRQWKISASDYKERDYWDDYIGAFEDALTNCSKDHAPWYVIPSNHKWFRNLAVSQIIADTMEDMKLKLPKQKKTGKLKAVVSYVPDTGFAASSTKVKVTITKK